MANHIVGKRCIGMKLSSRLIEASVHDLSRSKLTAMAIVCRTSDECWNPYERTYARVYSMLGIIISVKVRDRSILSRVVTLRAA